MTHKFGRRSAKTASLKKPSLISNYNFRPIPQTTVEAQRKLQLMHKKVKVNYVNLRLSHVTISTAPQTYPS